MPHYFESLVGRRFGFLIVLEFSHRKGAAYFWKCHCDCGNDACISRNNLINAGPWKSCGCKWSAWKKSNKSQTERRVKRIWNGMMSRCFNKEAKDYARYGGRGITICRRWQRFKRFYRDMGNPPTTRHSIERKNNDGPYSSDNCIWALPKVQQRNRRNTWRVVIDGVKRSLADVTEELGLPYRRSLDRLRLGMSLEEILSPGKLSRWRE